MNSLLSYRKNKGLTQQEVADKIGMSLSGYSRIEKGSRAVSVETLQKLADLYNVTVDDLLNDKETPAFGRPAPEAVQNAAAKPAAPDKPERKYKKFPVYGFIACGDPEDMTDYIVDEEYVDDSVYEGRDICLCICRGSSMAPFIGDGDLVILDRNFDFISGKIYAVQVNGEMATLKKVIKTSDGLDLIPLNPDYHTIHYSSEQCAQLPVRILGQLFRSTKHW